MQKSTDKANWIL